MTITQFKRDYPGVEKLLQEESLKQRGVPYNNNIGSFSNYINSSFNWYNSPQ